MKQYYELTGFEYIYLEDSFVKEIKDCDVGMVFVLDLVLLEKHPMFSKPRDNEKYCFVDARIIFTNISKTKWITKGNLKYRDATNSLDLGNIDSFSYSNGIYNVNGDWGEVEVTCESAEVVIDRN